MAFRFNFTRRNRVFEAEAKIHVDRDAKPLKVRLEQTFSKNYGKDDLVMLEAIRRTKLRRQVLGTIENLKPVQDVEFPDFPDGREVYYRLRIVDPETKKLKGLAKTLKDADREKTPGDIEPLLPVALSQPNDGLGNRFWMVKSDGEAPVLIISSKKFSGYEPVKSPEFKALVLPQVLREVLIAAFIHPEGCIPEWADKWKTFVTVNLGVGNVPKAPTGNLDEDYIRTVLDWIDDAVRKFADESHLSDLSIEGLTTTMEDNND